MKSKVDTREVTLTNLGIAAERALYYWQQLPTSVKSFYDADDMISDVVLHIYRKAGLHDSARARASTFVYHVATSRCKDIVAHYRAVKRGAALTVPLEENWAAVDSGQAEEYAEFDRYDEAHSRDAVERVLQYSPDFVQDVLAKLFSARSLTKLPPAETIEALKQVIAKQAATRKDFDTVLRCFVAAT